MVLKVGESMCLLAFLDKGDRDLSLGRYPDMFNRWFSQLMPWEGLDVSVANWY